MAQFGLYRGDELVGRVIFSNYESAVKERDSWNKQFEEYNEALKTNPNLTGKPIKHVEVKPYRKKRQTREQKMREMFG